MYVCLLGVLFGILGRGLDELGVLGLGCWVGEIIIFFCIRRLEDCGKGMWGVFFGMFIRVCMGVGVDGEVLVGGEGGSVIGGVYR